jgi:hypothetical protein
VERVRGTTPADSAATDQVGDLILDVLFDRAGCYDASSIAYWNDSVIFCDARGIFITDGAIVRNVTSQGGAGNLWRQTFERNGTQPISIAGVVHQDYYLCTVRHTGLPPITFVVEIPSRRIWTFSNIDAPAYTYSIGTAERLFGADASTKRVTDLTPLFNPDTSALQVDENGISVLPYLSSGWSLLTDKSGRKRVIDMHMNYLADRDDDQEVLRASYANAPTGNDKVLGEFRPQDVSRRLKIPVRREMEGISVTLQQLLPTKDTRLYSVDVRTYPTEQHRV